MKTAGLLPLVERLARWPAWIACGLLVFLMLMTGIDVALRYLFNAPIHGGLEISESAMVALVMLSMAHCGATGSHVRVDILDGWLGVAGRRLSDIVTGSISIVVLWFLVRRSWQKALDAHEYGDVTNFLQLPLWPLYALIAIGMGAYALVILAQVAIAVTGAAHERN